MMLKAKNILLAITQKLTEKRFPLIERITNKIRAKKQLLDIGHIQMLC